MQTLIQVNQSIMSRYSVQHPVNVRSSAMPVKTVASIISYHMIEYNVI